MKRVQYPISNTEYPIMNEGNRENRKKSIKKAFTLIELLVVIGIIGLLAGMLFPVLRKVQNGAKKTSCLNNLNQIGIAVNTYVNDYEGHLPICLRVPGSLDDPFSIVNTVVIKSKDVYSYFPSTWL